MKNKILLFLILLLFNFGVIFADNNYEQEDMAQEEIEQQEEDNPNIVEKEKTIVDYNESVRNAFNKKGMQDSIDELNECFEFLCKKTNQNLVKIVKERHDIILENLNKFSKENKLNTTEINNALYDISYIFTQNKNLPNTFIDPSIDKISLAGYTLATKYKNKGEHIPNISNVEFLSQGGGWFAPDFDYIGENLGLNINSNKYIYHIEVRVPNNKTKQFKEYMNKQIVRYKSKKIYTISKQTGWQENTVTTFCKGFRYINHKTSNYNSFYINTDGLKENIENLYPIYDEKNNLKFEMFTKSYDGDVIMYYDEDGDEIVDSLDNYYAEIKFIDKWEPNEKINEDKKTIVEFLNKYKIGKKLNTESDEVEYDQETTINNTIMYIFKNKQVFCNEEYNVYFFIDKNTKIIKALKFKPSENCQKVYDLAIADVYDIKNYYCKAGVGQKITQKKNITTKITRIKHCDVFYDGEADIITSLPKLEY